MTLSIATAFLHSDTDFSPTPSRCCRVEWDKLEGHRVVVSHLPKNSTDGLWRQENKFSCRNLPAALRKFSKIVVEDRENVQRLWEESQAKSMGAKS